MPVSTDRPSLALAWGSRLVLLVGLAFAVYGTEYGGGMLFSVATGVIGVAFVASFWRPRVGVLGAGTLLTLLVLVQVVT